MGASSEVLSFSLPVTSAMTATAMGATSESSAPKTTASESSDYKTTTEIRIEVRVVITTVIVWIRVIRVIGIWFISPFISLIDSRWVVTVLSRLSFIRRNHKPPLIINKNLNRHQRLVFVHR